MTRIIFAALLALAGFSARAQEVVFDDPKGDDNGPGTYTYPTDRVYKPGSFDITQFKVTERVGQVTFELAVNSDLEDPWAMGSGFSVQMAFVHVKTGPGGFTEGIPGTNVSFAPDSAWNKVVILSPQKPYVVKQELKKKSDPAMRDAALTPVTRGKGRVISATVDKKELGEGDITTWGYQVLMQSNEGFPDSNDVLTRKVNGVNGPHRFGGGDDGDCDPHVLDILGTPEQQKQWLAYQCGPDGSSVKKATLHTVYMGRKP
jgi:carbohydrate-binding DOMON domain-containing protein